MRRSAFLGLGCSIGASGDHLQRIENDRRQWLERSLSLDEI
jgi:hypothetical protein